MNSLVHARPSCPSQARNTPFAVGLGLFQNQGSGRAQVRCQARHSTRASQTNRQNQSRLKPPFPVAIRDPDHTKQHRERSAALLGAGRQTHGHRTAHAGDRIPPILHRHHQQALAKANPVPFESAILDRGYIRPLTTKIHAIRP